MEREKIIVSACLLGIDCRYDGGNCLSKAVAALIGRVALIPVCPELLGGLSTPRPPAGIAKGSGIDVIEGKSRVLTVKGEDDVTSQFIKGARESLKIAQLLGVKKAIFKEESPSCGVHFIRRNDTRVPGSGVTTALFLNEGLDVIGEEEIIGIKKTLGPSV